MSRRGFSILVLALTIVGGNLRAATDAPLPVQSYWFEVELKNLANKNERRGFVIDGDGRVCTFNLNHTVWEPEDAASITEEELAQKYAPSKKCGAKIDEATFLKYKALILAVTKGRVVESPPACTNSGTLAYRAFVFNTMNQRYHPRLLAIGGDTVRANSTDAAAELVQWLKTIKKQYAKPPCKELLPAK